MSASPAPAGSLSPARRRRLFADRPVGAKFGAVVGLLALASAGLTILATTRLETLDSQQDVMFSETITPLSTMGRLGLASAAVKIKYVRLPMTDGADRDKTVAGLQDSRDQVTDLLAELDAQPGTAGYAQQIQDAFDPYYAIIDDRYMPLVEADDDEGAAAIANTDLVTAGTAIDDAIKAVEAELTENADDVADSGTAITRNAKLTMWLALAGALAAAISLAVVVIRQVLRALTEVQRSLAAMAEGDLTREPAVHSADELGQMSASLATAQRELRSTISGVVETAQTVAAATEQLSAASTQVTASSQETATQSGTVAASAEQVSRSVQTVAAGAEQMGASIQEIAQNASQAAKIAGAATEMATTTNEQVSRLGESSQEIGAVVKAITSIAEQTNLLALNATIEAARAGEAGKGFAVVAGEVKELAQETAKATEDIARRVEAIQADTGGAVTAIGEISQIIASINDYQLTIASAVEEQTATTNEMSRSVAEAATGSGEIAVNITGVASAAASQSDVLGQVGQSVVELAQLSSDLDAQVARFRY
jgi:methyl-accepting chemotaxis protein